MLKDISEKCKKNNCNLILPEDVIVAKDNKSKGHLKTLEKINDNDLILDIGEKTSNKISKIINESKTILWNGPAGYFENEEFSIDDGEINEFDINHVRKSKSIVLSGGERRRLEIARTLASRPKYLLLDEPLTGIDPVSIEEIKIIIKKLKQKNIGVLITDHNVRETLKIVDKVYIVNEGMIFFSGNPNEAISDDRIKKFYLGSDFSI